jgi:hypothetical protein
MLARQFQGLASEVAQGVVPAAGKLPPATAHAFATGAHAAFASALDLAMLLTAALVLAVGLIALVLMRPEATATAEAAGNRTPALTQRSR